MHLVNLYMKGLKMSLQETFVHENISAYTLYERGVNVIEHPTHNHPKNPYSHVRCCSWRLPILTVWRSCTQEPCNFKKSAQSELEAIKKSRKIPRNYSWIWVIFCGSINQRAFIPANEDLYRTMLRNWPSANETKRCRRSHKKATFQLSCPYPFNERNKIPQDHNGKYLLRNAQNNVFQKFE